MKRALVVSPHSDDAVISLGSMLYNEFARATIVVPFNRSLESVVEVDGDVTARRKAEDREVSGDYGFSFIYGEFADSSLRGVPWDAPDAPIDAPLLSELGAWLHDATRGSYDASFYPAAVGGHPDHVLCKVAARGFEHGRASTYRYIEQPYALERRLPLGPSIRSRPFDPAFKRRMLGKYPSQLSPERIERLVGIGAEYFTAW